MSSLFDSDDSSTNAYFYAIFTTSEHAISASAVCVFFMNDIISSFNSDYSTRRGSSSKPLQVPNPRPSSCPANLTNEHLLFSRKNVLMKNEVYSEALIIESGLENSFLKIDVDFHVNNSFDELFDVLFVSTDNGQLMKFVVPIDKMSYKSLNNNSMINSYYKEKFNLVEHDQKRKKYVINNLKFVQSSTNDKNLILMINSNKIISLSKPVINNCYLKKNISNCNNHLNPYCIWIDGDGCKVFNNNNSDLLKNFTKEEESTKILLLNSRNDIYDLTTSSSYLNNNSNQNVYLITIFYIISIFASFLFGSLLTFKLIENKKKFSFKSIIVFDPDKYAWMVSRCRDVHGSVVRVCSRFKKVCYDFYKRIRNYELFKKRNLNTNGNDKQIGAESFSSITISDSEKTDPRYVYVVVENHHHSSSNNDNYSYLNNNENRTIQSSSNEDIYLN